MTGADHHQPGEAVIVWVPECGWHQTEIVRVAWSATGVPLYSLAGEPLGHLLFPPARVWPTALVGQVAAASIAPDMGVC